MLKSVELHGARIIKPDILKRKEAKADEIAAAVGQAADVLTDAEPRSW